MPAIEFAKVVFGYSSEEVLHSISFSVRAGEVVGLLGPNGAGKSTAIKLMAGLLTPSSGSIRILELPLPEQAVAVKQRIGYVPETAALFESLTGQEFLELSGRLHGVDEEVLQRRIAEILEAFSLSGDRVSPLESYSKGMRQKILIGSALLHDPDLLLLDEPLSGLDVHSAVLVKDLIAGLSRRGKTVLYSSHVLDVVERVCHRVLIVDKGALIADSPTNELLGGTGGASLEEVFRNLTGDRAFSGAERILNALEQ